MTSIFDTTTASPAIPISFVAASGWEALRDALPAPARQFALANAFAAKPGQCLTLPGSDGNIAQVLFGLEEAKGWHDRFRPGQLPALLPAGLYRFANAPHDMRLAVLAFALGSYRFNRYRKAEAFNVRLAPPEGIDIEDIARMADAARLARDLINTPPNDMGPEQLAQAAQDLAKRFGASYRCIIGEDLLDQNFPLIHAVGAASPRAPRLIDLSWGEASHPKVTLVGKGVCFDTGGLDIKTPSGMLLMKKDMGGAANVLGLAALIMGNKLDVRLRVLIPAVENAISANAFRPGDILPSRKGLSVEIGNTDAEGRLVLADALALADEEEPQILIDMATLTGAARVALGPDLPPFFTRDETLAADLAAASSAVADPLWRMPLWSPYASKLSSRVADLNNVTSDGFAGAVTAALFLQRFVEKAASWVHFDVFGWRPDAKPHCPIGGEAQAIRALESVLASRYG